MKVFLLSLVTFFSLVMSPILLAQEAAGEGDIFSESMGDMFIVLGTAAGGAILGLSTLSFQDEPWDHTKNILIGLSIGTIVGVGVVAWQQATKSKTLYEETQASIFKRQKFGTIARNSWHQKNHQNLRRFKPETFNFNLSF